MPYAVVYSMNQYAKVFPFSSARLHKIAIIKVNAGNKVPSHDGANKHAGSLPTVIESYLESNLCIHSDVLL